MTERHEVDHAAAEFDRRAFVKRMALAAFAVPVVASFKLDSLARAQTPKPGPQPWEEQYGGVGAKNPKFFPGHHHGNGGFPGHGHGNGGFPGHQHGNGGHLGHLPPRLRMRIKRLLRKLRRRRHRRYGAGPR